MVRRIPLSNGDSTGTAWERTSRRSHANRLNLTGGGRASVVRQALTTPVQERSRPLDAPSTGEQSRERRIAQPDARLDERDGAGDRVPNRRLIHKVELGGCPPRHDFSESTLPLAQRSLSLSDQNVGSVAKLLALFHEVLRRFPYGLRLESNFSG